MFYASWWRCLIAGRCWFKSWFRSFHLDLAYSLHTSYSEQLSLHPVCHWVTCQFNLNPKIFYVNSAMRFTGHTHLSSTFVLHIIASLQDELLPCATCNMSLWRKACANLQYNLHLFSPCQCISITLKSDILWNGWFQLNFTEIMSVVKISSWCFTETQNLSSFA